MTASTYLTEPKTQSISELWGLSPIH